MDIHESTPNVRIVSEPRAESADATFVRDSLALFNVAVTGDSYYSPLAIFLKDERGAVLGGALGHIWGGWLDLDTLWVAEPRKWDGPRYGASPPAPLAPRCPRRLRPDPPCSPDNRRLPGTASCRRGRSPR